ncbi:MAG: glycine cleavage T C-terminal barrel domain-containing protein, partial [Alphaproteobacteria bacterium]
LDSMRLEKGYRSWKSDLTSDYTMLESGLGRWVNFDKPDFVGRTSLLTEYQAGTKREFVTLTLDDPEDGEAFGEAVYLSTVLVDGVSAGLVVSAGYGHRVGKSIAMAVLDKDAVAKGGAISVDVLGRKRAAKIVDGGVLYDPDNSRMKV